MDDTTAPATLAIDGVTLEASSAARSGIVLEGLSLEVGEGASVTADSVGTSVKTDRDITVSEKGSLHATSDGSYGVRADGDIAVTDATLNAASTSVAVCARGSVSVSDAEVTTESAPNSLRSEGTLSVSGDSVVTAVGGVFGEKGVSVAPVDGEKVDLWLGASEAEAAHYESADGSLRSPFDAPVTINTYTGSPAPLTCASFVTHTPGIRPPAPAVPSASTAASSMASSTSPTTAGASPRGSGTRADASARRRFPASTTPPTSRSCMPR